MLLMFFFLRYADAFRRAAMPCCRRFAMPLHKITLPLPAIFDVSDEFYFSLFAIFFAYVYLMMLRAFAAAITLLFTMLLIAEAFSIRRADALFRHDAIFTLMFIAAFH